MGGGGRAPTRGSDIEVRLSMTLQEAFTGVTKDVKVLRRAPCAKCNGTGAAAGTTPETSQHCGGRGQVMHSQGFLMTSTTCPVCRGEGRVVRKPCGNCDGTGLDHEEDMLQVSIPAGVEDGSTLRMTGRGEAAPHGGRAGDLYAEIAVSFPQLALGDKVDVPTLDGEGAIEIPPGTQPGETLSLRGRGMPRLDGRGRGDIVAHLKLVVPSSLSAEEDAALRAYAAAGGQRVSPERGGFCLLYTSDAADE